MYEKFGEFDSADEINKLAKELKELGGKADILILAKENGIEKDDVDDYMEGYVDALTNNLMAAVGKLDVESEEYKIKNVLKDWVDELKAECMESEELARAVRRKGKGLDGFIALLADTGFDKKTVVDKKIVNKCKGDIKRIVGTHDFYIGIPDKETRRALMYMYYTGKKVD